MSILHPTQAHRRLRLAFQIGCAVVAVTVLAAKDTLFSTSHGIGVVIVMIAFLLFTYVLLLRERRHRATKTARDRMFL